MGLANTDVFAAKRRGVYSTEFLEKETSLRGVQIAVIYDPWFTTKPDTWFEGPRIPPTWVRIGRWTAPRKEQLGDDTVSFYALKPEETERLRVSLKEFEKRLPRAVKVTP